MIPFPTTCPACEAPTILYSVGVVPSRLTGIWNDYPVVWCDRCRTAYFTCLPSLIWCRCDVNKRVMPFTADPDTIDPRLKLAYDYKLVAGVKIFAVYPVSREERRSP